MRKTVNDPVAEALRETLISPNVSDANLEPANVVDALAEIAHSLRKAGDRIGGAGDSISDSLDRVAAALDRVADAIASRPS